MSNSEYVDSVISVLESSSNRANYPAVMIHTLLKNDGAATKTMIAEALAKANNSTNVSYYRGVPVFTVNKAVKSIVTTDRSKAEHSYFLTCYHKLDKKERARLMAKALQVAKSWEKRTA